MFISIEMDGGQGKYVTDTILAVSEIKSRCLPESARSDFYVTKNGKILNDGDFVRDGTIRFVPRLVGGKGGFGSMLRAIGAQIEKTTNREACRDLSGRRLRDINEEKRLKNWIAQQAERERETAERRKKKLERLCYQPKHDFSDQDYEKARSELAEKVHDAVEEGFRKAASSSTSGAKRKPTEPGPSQAKKKKTACLWLDADEDELSSSLDSSDSETENKTTSKGNEGKLMSSLNGGERTEAACSNEQLGAVGVKKSDTKCTDQPADAKSECEEKVCEEAKNVITDKCGKQSESTDNDSADHNQKSNDSKSH